MSNHFILIEMNKQEVMEKLLSADANVPADVIMYVGANLSDKNEKVSFNHDADSIFEACGIEENDVEEMHNALQNFMDKQPKGQKQKSKAVEFIVNSGNVKWHTISTIIALQKSERPEKSEMPMFKIPEELKDLLLKALLKRLKDGDE